MSVSPTLQPVDGQVSPAAEDRSEPVQPERPAATGPLPVRWLYYLPPLLVGLGIRLYYALGAAQPAVPKGADQYYYRSQAELITHGHWFVIPGSVVHGSSGVPGLAHPPLFSTVLAVADLIGLRGVDGQRAFLCVLSVIAIFCCGRIGARLPGRATEMTVAWVAAVLPGMWIYSGQVLSESITIPVVAGTLFALYRMWERPTHGRTAVLGLMIALCALTRPELLALAVVFAPLWLRSHPWKKRMTLTLTFLAVLVVLVGPWVGRNLHDFRDQEIMSANLGSVVVGANCNATYSGPLLGTWDSRCVSAVHPPPGDDSTLDHFYLAAGEHYIGKHTSRVPTVIAARLGRSLGVWPAPAQQVSWNSIAAGVWPRWSSWLYWVTWIVSIPFVLIAVVSLRRRRAMAWPLYVLIGLFFVVSAALNDNVRYASSCQPALAVLVGVGLTTAVSTVLNRQGRVPRGAHSPGAQAQRLPA
ncbi:MAG TPA: hypothetical protein VHU17_02510 [Acidimicrobiales bacterium]|nr:hypothetical protein [Acidimicrobiales bacterium]